MPDLPGAAKTVIIGGGIVGCSTAYHLATMGEEVVLLERAKQLVNKDFMEIINDLAPNGLSQVQAIRGTGEEDSSGY